MKICFVTTVYLTLDAFVTAQAQFIHEKHPEYEIFFICDYNESFEKSLPDYIKYIPVSMNRGVDLKGIKTIFALKKIFKKNSFDLIIYATPNASLYSSFAGRMAGIKKRLYCQWGIRYVGFSGIKRLVFKSLEKITCLNSTFINAVSPRNRQFAIDEGLYKPEKAVIVGNGGTVGVDLNLYDINKYNDFRSEIRNEYSIKNEFVLGFVGRLSRDKGAFELLSAIKEFSEKNNIKLMIVGANELSEKDIPCELKIWAENSDRIIFTGSKDKEQVVKYYAAIDAYIHPSYREGFGMVLQEAGAMACPIITTDIPGAGEVFENGKSCLLAQKADVESLLCCIESLYNDRNLCVELGENARRCVEEKYERKHMLVNLVERYEKILGV